MLVGIDIGGTFTDVVVLRGDGTLQTRKVFSTPPDFVKGIADALEGLQGSPGFILIHGATVATNAILEGKGAKTVLITTEGFRDVLEIGRQSRPKLYALWVERPDPLVPRTRRLTVRERVTFDGTTLIPLTPREAERVIKAAAKKEAEAIAICLLFSFSNPNHEKMLAKLARKKKSWFVSVSHEILPEFREYERTITTVLNAYVGPLMSRYLKRLEKLVRQFGGKRLWVTQSGGGSVTPSFARRFPVYTIYSGPAAGVIGATFLARQIGFQRILTLDMGGTSTDVALCDGEPEVASQGQIGGLPLRIPTIAIFSIGAGGGSIAWRDAGGALRVGPKSAGANPGPACYGRGGKEPTVTDANLILGRLDPDRFWGGRLKLREDLAHEVIRNLGKKLKTSTIETASGIIAVVNTDMVRALLTISAERGYDPRDFALFAFGGAGGLHACLLADFLGIKTVLLPPYAGVLSALGAAVMDACRDYAQTLGVPLDEEGLKKAHQIAKKLLEKGRKDLKLMGFSDNKIQNFIQLDLRYQGQGYELTVPVTHWIVKEVRASFEALHHRRFGHHYPEAPIDLITVRVRVSGLREKPPLPQWPRRRSRPIAKRSLWEEGEKREIPVWDWTTLGAGHRLQGPCLFIDPYATAYLPSGWHAQVDRTGCLIVQRG